MSQNKLRNGISCAQKGFVFPIGKAGLLHESVIRVDTLFQSPHLVSLEFIKRFSVSSRLFALPHECDKRYLLMEVMGQLASSDL